MKTFCVFRFFTVGGWCRYCTGDVSSYSSDSPESANARAEVTNELRTLGWLERGDVIYIGGKFYLFRRLTCEEGDPLCITFEELAFNHSSVLSILNTYLMGG